MGRKRKNSEELARPRQVVAPVVPLNTRPRRTTKDAFYNNLQTLTATRKTPLEEELDYEEKPKVVKPKKEVVDRRKSSSSSLEPSPAAPKPQRPVLVKQKSEVLKIPLSSSSATKSKVKVINGLHHYISELRPPHYSLQSLDVESLSVDPRMQYSCNLCSRRFPRLKDLDDHLALHVETISSCALCEKPSHDFTMEEYTQHLSSHFLIEDNQTTCIFCGEVTATKPAADLAQHLLYYCPSIRYCFLCETEIDENKAHQHRKKHHTKLLNRYVCSTCFLGFPSLSPFLSHICDMRYRCLCEITDTFLDHNAINAHIDECEEVERQYHGILIPDSSGRKRCFFVNPHSIMPSMQNIPSTFGFRSAPNKSVTAGIRAFVEKTAETAEASFAEMKPQLPSSFPVPSTSAPRPTKRKYVFKNRDRSFGSYPTSHFSPEFQQQRRMSNLIDSAHRNRPYGYSFEENSPNASLNALFKAEFKQHAMGKPIYRPLKQQPGTGPSLIAKQNGYPRVIYPRNHRMGPRLLAPNSIPQNSFIPEDAEENIYDDFIPLTKQATAEETISPKRHRSTSDDAPEVITL